MENELLIIAGPCAVESENQIISIAKQLKEMNIAYLRGGAFKSRTCANSFQGFGEKGLQILMKAKEKTGMRIVTELMDSKDIDIFKRYYVDVIQIGTRNMFNYGLLKNIAKEFPKRTILIKRGFSATKKEFIEAIRYLQKYGHRGEIWACERGIRTFANGEYDRFTLDTGLIADLKQDNKFLFKIIVDPSHPAGRNEIVSNLAYAGIAAGAEGLLIEVKPSENYKPKSDANQAITCDELLRIIAKIKKIKEILRK